jgi:D-3-phosphoglycerate dehydrogenase
LYRALENGHLGGAALDVFPEEPYKGKLCDLENVVMTPHIATLTEESRLQMEIEATNSLLAYMNNRVSVEEN